MHYRLLTLQEKNYIITALNKAVVHHIDLKNKTITDLNKNIKDDYLASYVHKVFYEVYIYPIKTIINIIKKSINNDTNKVYFTVKQRKIIVCTVKPHTSGRGYKVHRHSRLTFGCYPLFARISP